MTGKTHLMTENNPAVDLDSLLSVAIQAAREAGKEIIEVYNSDDFQTEHKEDKYNQ